MPSGRPTSISGYIERSQKRGYASFFEWPLDRDLAELGVVHYLVAAMAADGQRLFENIRSRGRGNDPPDCEAIDGQGRRVAIEVTELVDPKGIANYQAGRIGEWAVWSRDSFLAGLADRLAAKARRTGALKGGPYPGGYAVVVFTDEPQLNQTAVNSYLAGHRFPEFEGLAMAFLLLGYDPVSKRCPWFRLAMGD